MCEGQRTEGVDSHETWCFVGHCICQAGECTSLGQSSCLCIPFHCRGAGITHIHVAFHGFWGCKLWLSCLHSRHLPRIISPALIIILKAYFIYVYVYGCMYTHSACMEVQGQLRAVGACRHPSLPVEPTNLIASL